MFKSLKDIIKTFKEITAFSIVILANFLKSIKKSKQFILI